MKAQAIRSAVLAVDDEPSVLQSYRVILEDTYDVHTAADGATALTLLSDTQIPLVILDLRLPDMDGLEVLRRMKTLDPDIEVIVVTGVNDAPTAVQAMRAGAASSSRPTAGCSSWMR